MNTMYCYYSDYDTNQKDNATLQKNNNIEHNLQKEISILTNPVASDDRSSALDRPAKNATLTMM